MPQKKDMQVIANLQDPSIHEANQSHSCIGGAGKLGRSTGRAMWHAAAAAALQRYMQHSTSVLIFDILSALANMHVLHCRVRLQSSHVHPNIYI
ncbi:hypothetical protein ACLOJK_028007 [Asimina triloba]